jgi:hypothetical protein
MFFIYTFDYVVGEAFKIGTLLQLTFLNILSLILALPTNNVCSIFFASQSQFFLRVFMSYFAESLHLDFFFLVHLLIITKFIAITIIKECFLLHLF